MTSWYPRCGGGSSSNAPRFLAAEFFALPSKAPPSAVAVSLASPEDFASIGSVIQSVEAGANVDSASATIANLPDHVLLSAFSFLKPRELCCSVAPVCSRWYHLAYNERLWRSLQLQRAALPPAAALRQLLEKVGGGLRHLALHLCEEPLSESALVTAGALPSLRALNVLDLGFNQGIDLVVLDYLVDQCPNVSCVNLEGSKEINDNSLTVMVSGWKELREICLSHCVYVSDEGVVQLAEGVRRMHVLNIDGISGISDEAVAALVQRHRGYIRRLYLDGAELTDLSIFYLAECSVLDLLSISFSDAFSDTALHYLQEMSCLSHLHFRKGVDLTASGVRQLFDARSLLNLTFLNLAECSAINDKCADALSKCPNGVARFSCTQLVALCLSWCWSLTDQGLTVLVKRLRQLRLLDLVGLDQIRGHVFADVPDKYLPQIVFVDLRECHLIDDELVAAMVARKADLAVANYYGELLLSDAAPQNGSERDQLKHLLDPLPGSCCMSAI